MREGARLMPAGARGSFFDRILGWCAFAACVLLVLQVVSVTVEVLLRLVLNVSLSWVTAFNEWSLLLIAFLGAAWLEREGGHTKDDSVIEPFPRARVVSDWIGRLLGIGICLLLIYYGGRATWEKLVSWEFDYFKMREIPVFWVYAFIPLGCLLWLIQLLRKRRAPPRGEAPPAAEAG
jgi:TRAP-type C4-dicarboxylate transport system permease small subunit